MFRSVEYAPVQITDKEYTESSQTSDRYSDFFVSGETPFHKNRQNDYDKAIRWGGGGLISIPEELTYSRATLIPKERENGDLDVTPSTVFGTEVAEDEDTTTTSTVQVEQTTDQIELTTVEDETSFSPIGSLFPLSIEHTIDAIIISLNYSETSNINASIVPVENSSLAPATQSATTLLTTCLMTLSQVLILIIYA